MQLVVIYGAEATGKLTIAKSLAEDTSFHLFHNHLSIDIAKVVFSYGEKGFADLVWDTRILVIDHAAKAGLSGLIFTWAYSHPDFLPYLARLRQVIEENHIVAHYVYLKCSLQERRRRVSSPDRVSANKISTINGLDRQDLRKNYDLIPDSVSLTLDNTGLTPAAAAAAIRKHFCII
jgi:hypothetical protein